MNQLRLEVWKRPIRAARMFRNCLLLEPGCIEMLGRKRKIFISYRRTDSSETTARIYERLVRVFGKKAVFRDFDSIPIGADFPEVITEYLDRCDVALIIIGPSWVSVADHDGTPRLLDPADLVRIEVEQAMGHRVPVIPVLVGNATMPRDDELPFSLEALRLKNAISVRPDPDFHHDVDRLIRGLRQLPLPERSRPSATVEAPAKTVKPFDSTVDPGFDSGTEPPTRGLNGLPIGKSWTAVSSRNRRLLLSAFAFLAGCGASFLVSRTITNFFAYRS